MSGTGVLLLCEELRACRVCLATDVRLEALRPGRLADTYVDLTGIPILPTDGLPQHLCSLCAALLKKSAAFRYKCRSTHSFLQQVGKRLHPLGQALKNIEDPMSLIRHLDRKYLKLPYITTDILTVSILGEVCNANEYVIPVKQETQIEVEKEESEDDCVLIEDCNDECVMLDVEAKELSKKEDIFTDINIIETENALDVEPIELSKIEEIFTDINITGTENACPIASSYNTVPRLNKKCVGTFRENEKIEKYLIKSKEETSDIHKSLFFNFVLDKYFYKTKESGSADEYDIFDSIAEEDTIISNVNNTPDICVISVNGNTVVESELNKNMFFHYIREKYVNKKGRKQVRKIVDRIRLRFKNLKCVETSKTEYQRKIQELRTERDIEFAKTYNFDIIRMTRNEQILEMERTRKKLLRYQLSPLKCEECFRGFRTNTVFQKHMRSHDPISGKHVCEVCKQRFVTRGKLYKHAQTHMVKFVCRQCKQAFNTCSKAQSHYKNHMGVNFECPHCYAKFRKWAARVNHIRIHHGATQCDICYEGFQGPKGVAQHKAKSHKQTYQCASCDVHFDNAHAMLGHIGSSPDGACDPNIRACAKCGERFDTDEQFDEHVARLHAKTREKERKPRDQTPKMRCYSKCCTCPRFEHNEDGGGEDEVSNNEYNVLNIEYNVPTGDPCPCSNDNGGECLCPTGLVGSCKLTKQGDPADKVDVFMRRNWAHKGCCKERRLMRSCVMCEVCAIVLSSQTALRVHQRVHTGEKPFQCNECSKRFRLKSNLKRHMSTHTGQRPYKCSYCPKAFMTYNNRKRHHLVHTQERLHRCEVCDKMFQTSTCVKTHVRTVHMKIPQPPRVRNRKRKCEWVENE